MQMTRITVPVTIEEREALRALAQRELRDPRDHARYLLRQALGLGGDNVQPNANRGAMDSDPQRAAVAS